MKRTRLKSVNKARRAKRLAENFGPQAILCRLLPCFACGVGAPCDPDHHPTRAAGGKDHNTAPLCRRCHDKRGSVGVVTFQRQWLIDLELCTRVLATIVRRAFRSENGWDAGPTPGRWKTPPEAVLNEAREALCLLRGGGDVCR